MTAPSLAVYPALHDLALTLNQLKGLAADKAQLEVRDCLEDAFGEFGTLLARLKQTNILGSDHVETLFGALNKKGK